MYMVNNSHMASWQFI